MLHVRLPTGPQSGALGPWNSMLSFPSHFFQLTMRQLFHYSLFIIYMISRFQPFYDHLVTYGCLTLVLYQFVNLMHVWKSHFFIHICKYILVIFLIETSNCKNKSLIGYMRDSPWQNCFSIIPDPHGQEHCNFKPRFARLKR